LRYSRNSKCPGKLEIIKNVQTALNLTADGIDGPNTWKAISDKIIGKSVPVTTTPEVEGPVVKNISDKAFDLIIKYEVGGGAAYYNKALKKPCYPGGASGVTIGIGYDLGYNTAAQFEKDWKAILPESDYNRLFKCLGLTSSKAKNAIASVRDIEIPWDSAMVVFRGNTIPRFMKETLQAFPKADQLHPDAFGALVSLVFNRGGSVSGERRSEMLNIRNLVPSKNYKAIAQEIIDMKRLWHGKGLDGLLKRRDEEAALIKACA
jgi:hypothetical protein